MGDEKNSDFDPDFKKENLAENLVTLRRSRSAFIGHITRLINKINEKLSLNDNFKTIKCLEEQLHQILEKLKGVNDEYISSAMNPEDIEKASEIYFEQHSRVIATSALIEQFVIKQQEVQSNIPPFQQEQYRDVLRSKSNLSHSSKSKSLKSPSSKSPSKHSKSSRSSSSRESTSRKKAEAELLAVQAKERFDRKKELLEKQKILELELENEHLIEAQNKLQLIRLADNFEKGSICSDNNRDLEGMSKTQVDKTNSSFPFTNKKIGNEISEKYLIPSKSITSSKSNSSINITDNINYASNAHSKDSNIPPKLPPKPKRPTNSDIDLRPSDLSISSRQIESVDLFIDLLVEGQNTILDTSSSENITVLSAVHQHLEAKNLPPIELLTFDGNPTCWPEFIENFKIMVHLKTTFNDTIRMERLHSVLRGEAKRSVESIGRNGIFYATTLKCLKREFGNPHVITHLKLKSLFDQPQIKAADHASLKLYHQKLKCTNTWLVSMGYTSTLTSIKNITKAVQRLPNYLRQTLYRHTREIIETKPKSYRY